MNKGIFRSMVIMLFLALLCASAISFAADTKITTMGKNETAEQASSAQKGIIKAELWGITWADGIREAREKLERHALVLADQGERQARNSLTFRQGTFLGNGCTIEMNWDTKRLTTIHVMLEAMSVQKGRAVYKEVVGNFEKTFGPIQKSFAARLKSLPAAFIQSEEWKVLQKDSPPFEIVITNHESQPGYWNNDRTAVGGITILLRLSGKERKAEE